MAFKMKYSPDKRNGKGFPYKGESSPNKFIAAALGGLGRGLGRAALGGIGGLAGRLFGRRSGRGAALGARSFGEYGPGFGIPGLMSGGIRRFRKGPKWAPHQDTVTYNEAED